MPHKHSPESSLDRALKRARQREPRPSAFPAAGGHAAAAAEQHNPTDRVDNVVERSSAAGGGPRPATESRTGDENRATRQLPEPLPVGALRPRPTAEPGAAAGAADARGATASGNTEWL